MANRREDLGIDTAYVPPCSAMEISLAETWQEVLNLDQIGGDDNFFELGGDSLGLTQVLMGIQKVWNVTVPVETFFDGATVRQLAVVVEAAVTERC